MNFFYSSLCHCKDFKKWLRKWVVFFCLPIVAAFQAVAQKYNEYTVTLDTYNIYDVAASAAKERDFDIIGAFLSSDALSELTDNDLGGALSRLSGINLVGVQGDSEVIVTIRCVIGQFNTTRINGAATSSIRVRDLRGSNSQNFTFREFELNQIHWEMVSGVEVFYCNGWN